MRKLVPHLELVTHIAEHKEPLWNQIEETYQQLTDIAYSFNILVEGNIYNLNEVEKSYIPFQGFLSKRHTYALFAAANNNILEIGFNAGHSALLALTANPELTYTAVDICQHAYTVPCYEFLKSKFGDRINLIQGDSRLIIPNLPFTHPGLCETIDGWIIDGSHFLQDAGWDIENVINVSKNHDRLLFDDTDHNPLFWLLRHFQMNGSLRPLIDLPQNLGNMVFEINK